VAGRRVAFLPRHGSKDPAAAATVLEINGGYMSVPTLILPDGRVLVEPSRRVLLSSLGLAS